MCRRTVPWMTSPTQAARPPVRSAARSRSSLALTSSSSTVMPYFLKALDGGEMERRAEKRGVEGKLAFLLRSSNQRRIVGLLSHRTKRDRTQHGRRDDTQTNPCHLAPSSPVVPRAGFSAARAVARAGSRRFLGDLHDAAVGIDLDPVAGLDDVERIAVEISDGGHPHHHRAERDLGGGPVVENGLRGCTSEPRQMKILRPARRALRARETPGPCPSARSGRIIRAGSRPPCRSRGSNPPQPDTVSRVTSASPSDTPPTTLRPCRTIVSSFARASRFQRPE